MATVTDDFLTNDAYGFPRGQARRISPRVVAVVHITANMGDAQAQRDYANRAGSNGPSAHFYVNRDGSAIHALDEMRFAAWSNGDLKSPKIDNAGIRYLVALTNQLPPRNANEGCALEIECVGTATADGQWTDAQFATVADLIATEAKRLGAPINDTTVIPHAYINTIDRAHCPSLHVEAHMTKLIALAKGVQPMMPDIDAANVVPLLVDIPAGARILNLDGSSRLTSPTERKSVLSPFGTTSLAGTAMRAIVWHEAAPIPDLMLAIYTNAVVNPQPVPSGDCSLQIAAAITADRARARIVYTVGG